MRRDFDPKRYWESKPWCSVCGKRKVRSGTICHECLAKRQRKEREALKKLKNKPAGIDMKGDAAQYEPAINPRVEIDDMPPELRERVERKIEIWKSRLIDLSRRNRLLNFRETKWSTLRILEPDPSTLFDRLVKEQAEYVIHVQEQSAPFEASGEDNSESTGEAHTENVCARSPNELVYQGSPARAERVFHTLRSRAHTELEERGVNVLFIAIGFLQWTEATTSSVQWLSPLILVPVVLTRDRSKQRYHLTRAPEDIVMNPALVLKLNNDFDITLPDLPEDAEDVDLNAFLAQAREAVSRFPWEIREEVQIGLFSFLKFMMYKDLDASQEQAVRHRIIGALAGLPSILPEVPPDLVTAERLDEAIPPERMFQILDADSSQQEAIATALAEVNFVLRGPPGTGKSQTIANIIAEFLAAGKRVLFVSEKMAALEVVKRRLDDCGIGEFCLELHSHKTDKRTVLKELGDVLNSVAGRGEEPRFPFGQFKERRRQLNDLVKALHTPRGVLQLKPFDAHANLARFWAVPDVSVRIRNPLQVTDAELDQVEQLLKRLATNKTTLQGYDHHPWKDTLETTWSLHRSVEIEQHLRSLIDNIDKAITLMSKLTPLAQDTFNRLEDMVLKIYPEKFLELDLDDLIQRFSGPYHGWRKYFHYPGYKKALGLVRYHAGKDIDSDTALNALRLALLVRNGRRLFVPDRGRVQTKKSSQITISSIASFVGWAQNCASTVDDCSDQSLLEALGRGELDELNHISQEEQDVLTSLTSERSFLEGLFPSDRIKITEHRSLTEAWNWLRLCLERLPDLKAWVDVQNTLADLRKIGYSDLVDEILKHKIDPAVLPDAFSKRFYQLWIDEITSQDPALSSFQSTQHEQVIDEFRRWDEQLKQTSRRRIITQLRQHRGEFVSSQNPGISILQREIQKRRRHKPLRRLFAEIPGLIQALKPCFLMSPMSVASYLAPGKIVFDVVIFDEASQIMPEDAIGSILRSSQAVVVGDTKQLPPTRFFATVEGDDGEGEDLPDEAPLDSILEEALAAGLSRRYLLWHYRSRNELLIAFSNQCFYGNKLITFPSAGNYAYPTGVEFVFVPDGIYDRSGSRTNRREARRVAELVYQHYQQFPERSLGVVAFSLQQSEAIDAAVEELRRKDPGFDEWCNARGTEPFFIKNLENVQGDERDVMFFSVGYGPDQQGRIFLNFGPLNQEGGPRRLNVAVTRAKEHVKLISSLDPSQIDLSKTRAEGGVRLLKEYMEFAKRGINALHAIVTVDSNAEFGSPFEETVYEALTAGGLHLQKQVGVSGYRIDLGVVDPDRPGRFLLGIECDGATYHSFKTARDRDRLRQQVLEGLGWKIHRIWSRDWIENRQGEIKKVLSAVRAAQSGHTIT